MPNNTGVLTVFIVDDDVELCKSLHWLLESVGLNVQIFNNGHDFLYAFNPTQSGCILLDIRMPIISGLELQAQLKFRKSTLPIIFMTGHGDIPMAVRAMKEGAFDFLTKPFNDQQMLERIQQAIAHHQLKANTDQQCRDVSLRFKSLTARQHEVLKLIIKGKLNKEIAYTLNISIKTVELHRSQIMQKMKVNTVVELVKLCLAMDDINKTITLP